VHLLRVLRHIEANPVKAGDAGAKIRQRRWSGYVHRRSDEDETLAILTPQQKADRIGYKLCNSTTSGKLGGVLTSDQVNKIKGHCMTAGVAVGKGSVSLARAQAAMRATAVSMLTDAQKKKLGIRVEPKKKPKPKKKKSGGGAAGKIKVESPPTVTPTPVRLPGR